MLMGQRNEYGMFTNLPFCEGPDLYGRWKYRRIDLSHSRVDITVRGFVAHVSLDLKYVNNCGRTVEVTYACPIDAKSAIFEFKAELNGRIIHAHCIEKKKAESIYKDAVSRGHTAIIASEAEQASDLLHISLGNLDRDETAVLHIEMVMELPVGTDGSITFTLPIVFNPRYSPHFETIPTAVVATGSSMHLNIYSIDIKAKVIGSLKIDKIVSSVFSFQTILNEKRNEAELNNILHGQQNKDWSFQIYYHSPHKPHILMETGDRSASGMMADNMMMLNLFPEMPMDAFSPHNEIIFVVDCSGSMEDKMQETKSTLLLFLKSLPHGCRFNIISFGSSFKLLFNDCGSERYTEATLNTALHYQQSLKADLGGTEIYLPLKHIYSREPTAGYARQILLLTDGEVWNVNEISDLVSRNSADTRLFTVGIGAGASTALVQGLALAGNGRYEMVSDSSQLQIKVMGLIASMLQQSVTEVNVNIELDPPTNVVLIPNVSPVIFGGQHLILYARIPPKSIVNNINISGKVGDIDISVDVDKEHCKQIHDTKLCLHRIAAKRQICEWQLKDNAKDDALIALSTTTGVACRLTALVGIDQEGKKYRKTMTFGESRSGFPFGSQPSSSTLFGASCQPQSSSSTLFGASSQPQSSSFGMFGASSRSDFSFGPQPSSSTLFGASSQPQSNSSFTFGTSCQPQFSSSSLFGASSSSGFNGLSDIPQSSSSGCFGASSSSQASLNVFGGSHNFAQPYSTSNFGSATQSSSIVGGMPIGSSGIFCQGACESENTEKVNLTKGDDVLLEVIKHQNFDGSWCIEICSTILLISDPQLKALHILKQEFHLDDASFATAVCLAWFRVNHLERKQEWNMINIKGSMFLKAKGLDSTLIVDKCIDLYSSVKT